MTRLEAAHAEFDRQCTDLLQSLKDYEVEWKECYARYMATNVELREALDQLEKAITS